MAGRGAAREYRKQDGLGLRLFAGDKIEDRPDSGSRVLCGEAAVVRADHQHDAFCTIAV